MKEIFFKYKIVICLLVIMLSIYLYSNKPYSLYEINHVNNISKVQIDSIKTFYFRDMTGINTNNKNLKINKVYIKKNQNLSSILKKLNIIIPASIFKKTKNNCLYNLGINDEITITTNGANLISLVKRNSFSECVFNSSNNSIKQIKDIADKDIEQLVFFNTIESSFYSSALNANLTPNETMSLADIFGWDINFANGIRKGDMFAVVIDRTYSNKKHTGSIIKYAIFKNKKNVKVAYRYNKKYFNTKGRSLQKQFLRAPIDSYRISSGFNRKRLHPIFKTIRPHLGTDYAAPKGTPVYSTGDGTIIYKGRKGGYGNTIIVKHGNIYSTLYAHFSKYKKGTYVGKKVKQKEVIGYVGSTGYATGPHVHYEFRVRGKHKNSLKIKFKKGTQLNDKTLLKMMRSHKNNLSIYSWLDKKYINNNYEEK